MIFDENTQQELLKNMSHEEILDICVMWTLIMTLKKTKKHLSGEKSFGHKCIKKMRSLYWRDEDDALRKSVLALERYTAITSWETAVVLNGLGGSDPDRLSLEWHLDRARKNSFEILDLYREGKTYKDWFEDKNKES